MNGSNEDVTDSTEWSTTRAPFMMRFEDLLRCPICSDIFKSPAITDCSHTFCGVCIRRHLNIEAKCPTCRAETQLSRLRPNKATEEICDSYTASRGTLLSLLSPNKNTVSMSTEEVETLDPATSSSPQSVGTEPSSSIDIPEGAAQCPICNLIMPVVEIEGSHIEKCLSRGEKRAHENTTTNDIKRLKKEAKPMYSMMPERKIRDLLAQCGLPSNGNKRQLIARHQEWVAQWNTSVESSHPKSAAEIRKAVMAWDRTQSKSALQQSQQLKDLDSSEWSKSHESGFMELAELARRSKKNKASSPELSDVANNEN